MEVRKKVLKNGKATIYYKVPVNVIEVLRFQSATEWNKESDGALRIAGALENIDPWIEKVEGEYKTIAEVIADISTIDDCIDIVLDMAGKGKPTAVSETEKKPSGKRR